MSVEYVTSGLTRVYKCEMPVVMRISDERLILNDEENRKIQQYWQQALLKNDALFNGDVLTVKNIQNTGGALSISLFITDYAHLTYTMNHEEENITSCKSVAAGGLLITKDNYILLGKMGKKTSFPGIVQCIGGGIAKEDIQGEEPLVNTVVRECFEEIGVQTDTKAIDISGKYVYVRNKMSTIGFGYVVNLGLCRGEINYIFDKLHKGDEEIEQLVYIENNKEAVIEFCKENKVVDYLRPVLYDFVDINRVDFFM